MSTITARFEHAGDAHDAAVRLEGTGIDVDAITVDVPTIAGRERAADTAAVRQPASRFALGGALAAAAVFAAVALGVGAAASLPTPAVIGIAVGAALAAGAVVGLWTVFDATTANETATDATAADPLGGARLTVRVPEGREEDVRSEIDRSGGRLEETR